jgi:hypothetical protein
MRLQSSRRPSVPPFTELCNVGVKRFNPGEESTI